MESKETLLQEIHKNTTNTLYLALMQMSLADLYHTYHICKQLGYRHSRRVTQKIIAYRGMVAAPEAIQETALIEALRTLPAEQFTVEKTNQWILCWYYKATSAPEQ